MASMSSGFGQRGHRRIFFKQGLHYHVHPGIGALGRQPDAYQKLPRMVVVQRTACVGVFGLEPPDDLQRQFLLGRQVFGGSGLSAHMLSLDS